MYLSSSSEKYSCRELFVILNQIFGRSVDFQYPMTDKLVLKDMSFFIDSGQLCVIVGENGLSWKCIGRLTTEQASRVW